MNSDAEMKRVKVKVCDLFRLFDSVSEERRLVLAVVKQDVEGHLAAQHVVDGLLHHAVEVSGGERVVQHVADLNINDTSLPARDFFFFNQITLWGFSMCVTLYFFPSRSSGSSLTSDLRARPNSSSFWSESDRLDTV